MNFKLLLKDPTLEILSLLEYKNMTVKELMIKLGSVPKATLYRHIKKMYENDFIKIHSTRFINGLKQHTYAVNKNNVITEDDFKNISEQERINIYMKNFMSFIKSVIKLFRDNTYNNDFSLIMVKFKIFVTKEESLDIYRRIKEIMVEYNEDSNDKKGRHREEISFIVQNIHDNE